ncbi:unnamed protein product, partial [Rotaria sordida]
MSDVKIEEDRKELEQLRETVAFLTTQCTQLNEANDAWQQYQEAQLQNFRSKLHDYFSMDENTSLDIIAQQIVEQWSKEREDFNEKYQTLEKVNDILRSESTNNLESMQQDYTNTINELNQKLLVMNKQCEDLSTEKQLLSNELGKRSIEIDRDQAKPTIEKVSSNILRQPLEEVSIHTSDDNIEQDRKELEHLRETVAVLTTQCAQLDEANRAWQQYQQIQLDTFRNVFHQYLPIDESFTLNNATQQLFDQITKEKEDFNERYQALEKLNDDLRLESATNLETIKESYINAIDELNKELLSMKEQCEILIAEKEILTSELEKKPVELNKEQTEEIIGSAPINLLQEVPLQTSASNFDQENEELQQLRENFTILTSQYAQLNEANRAWQEFHQSEVDNFRKNIQDFIPIDDNLSFDHIAQKIMDEITKEREYSNERYQTLEKAHNDLQSESIQENKEFLLLKEQYDQILREKQLLINQIENQPIINKHERDTQTIESIDSNLLEQQTKMSQLQENLISLRTQLDETNHSWQEFEQTQSNLLQTLLPYSTKTSLEELIQEIILHINHLTKEIDLYKEKESQHDDNKIEDELTILQNQCTELDAANRAWQLFYDNQIDLLKDKLKDYINFNHNENFDQIIQLIVVQFEQQKQFNENISLDTTKDNLDLLKNQINNFQDNEQLLNQQILTLQQECQNLEQQLKENQLNIDSFKTNLQLTLNENEQLKQDYDELQQKNNLLINTNQDLENQLNEYEQQSSYIESQDTSKQMIQKEIRHTPIQEIQIHRLTPVQSRYSPNIDEELRQLRTDLTASSAHCLQLEEANRAWQQFHQNQLELFRQKLQNSIPLDENFTLEQIAQQVLIHLQQLENNNQLDTSSTIDSLNKQLTNYQLNESILSQNLEQLNQKLLDVYRECEEFRDHNAQLILSKQQIEQQIDELQLSNNNLEKFYDLQQHNESLRLENQQLQLKLNDMEQRLNQFSINSTIQRVDSTRENIGIHNIDREPDDEIHQLQTDLAVASNRCFELEAANSAWQKYQYEQIESLRKKLQEQIPSLNQIENSSLDFITQQILDYLHQLNIQRDNLLHQNDLLKDEIRLQKQQLERPRSVDSMQRMLQKRSHNKNITEPQIHSTTSSQSPSPLINEHEQELQQLRDNVTLLTNQCAQLDEANRAWQQYQQTQLDTFKNIFQHYLPIDETFTLNQAAQQILQQITKEKEDFNERYQTLEKLNDDLRLESATNLETIKESYINTIDELNKELLCMKEQYEQTNKLESSSLIRHAFEDTPLKSSETVDQQEVEEIQQLRENLISLTAQLDETKQTWQQYQQTQFDILRNQLQDCLSIDSNITFDEIAQQIVDQVTKEREDFTGKYQELEKQNDNLRSELTNNMESIRESYVNTVNELNQELLIMTKQCEQFDAENQLLTNELEKQSIQIHEEQIEPTIEKIPLNILKQPFEEVPIHTSSMNVEDEGKELEQLRERVAHLTTQCAQLDEANRAWQLYQEAQLENFRSKLHDCLSFDENMSFDMIAQQIVEQISKEREDFNERYQGLEKTNDVLRSESTSNLESIQQSYINTIDELNQELLVMKKQCEDLDAEKQVLSNELEKQSVEVDQNYPKQTTEKVSSNILRQPFEEIPTHMSGVTAEEERKDLEQLQETVAFLTTQCAQLDEANRAWQQYQEAQLQNFRSKLHDYFSIDENTSFDMIAQQIVEQISKEREDFNERYQAIEKADVLLHPELTNNFESVEESYRNTINELNQELLAVKTQCEHLDVEKQLLSSELEKRSAQVNQEQIERSTEKVSLNIMKQPFEEVPIHTSVVDEQNELEQLREAVAFVTAQCAQLDEANRAWQQYQQTQLHVFLSKLHDYLPIEESTSFDEIAQHIVNQIIQEREDFNIRYQVLEKELNNLRSESGINIQSDVNTVNKLNEELLAIKEAYEKLDAEKQLLVMQLESLSTRSEPKQTIEKISWNEPFEKVPIHTTIKEDVEELEQLRERVALLTNQCTQLDESNRTWQQYQQTQLENFRNKLHDYLPIDENISLDDIAQQIIKDHENFNEKYSELEKINDNLLSELTMNIQSVEKSSTDNIDELNEELFILKNQNEELEKINKQLLEKENLNNPLSDRSIVLGHHSGSELNIIQEETPMELKENLELQSSSPIPIETEEINKIRSDLALITCQFNQLTETNQNELDLFRSKLQNWISLSPNSTLDEIAQLLDNQFEQKYNLETIENSTQTIEPSEKIHISTETIPILYENHQTQIDPIDMINQEIQTESFQQLWSI